MNVRYQDNEGNEYHIALQMFRRGNYWSTFRDDGGMVNTRFLPLRNSPEQAQADLKSYAARKGWKKL
jgi:hypothetical protein